MTVRLLPALWLLAACLPAAQNPPAPANSLPAGAELRNLPAPASPLPAGAELRNPPAPASPLPTAAELREILKNSVEEGNLNFAPPQDYVYIEDRESRLFDSKGKPTPATTETYEGMALYGQRYERLIRKDGKPLASKQERAEQDKLDKEAAKRKQEPAAAKARRLEAERQRRLACRAEFVDGFHFSLLGAETVGGRPAWKMDASPIPGGGQNCAAMKRIKSFHLTIWIDQADAKWSRLEAHNVASVALGAMVVRFPAGSFHVSIEPARRDDGAWLPDRVRIRMNMRFMLLVTLRLETVSTYSKYRKFQTESRIVEEPPAGGL
jgi:hypothetical protein